MLNFLTAHVWLRCVMAVAIGILMGTVMSMSMMYLRGRRIYDELESGNYNHYFCGYSLADMISADFFSRFSSLNQEGFCYTYSAVIMLTLRKFKHTRVVRGRIDLPAYRSNHSWTEIRIRGQWWVIDLVNYPIVDSRPINFMPRRFYYQHMRPKILVTYRYKEFWGDPLAVQFYECLREPETSGILLEIYHHYTPLRDGIEIGELDPYEILPEELGYDFSQETIDMLMANPNAI